MYPSILTLELTNGDEAHWTKSTVFHAKTADSAFPILQRWVAAEQAKGFVVIGFLFQAMPRTHPLFDHTRKLDPV